mmetsp:Transcript_29833/g.77010  ORF Transcript_29833/g.77010 Transcript_29833/m.77010 type:complete len:96 (-) Transcript_29833:1231-1518(-)
MPMDCQLVVENTLYHHLRYLRMRVEKVVSNKPLFLFCATYVTGDGNKSAIVQTTLLEGLNSCDLLQNSCFGTLPPLWCVFFVVQSLQYVLNRNSC